MASELKRHWPIVAACAIGLGVSAAPAYIGSFGLFMKLYVDRFGWSRGDASLALVLAGLAAASCTPLAGWAIDRIGARRVVLAGCAAFPLALLAYAVLPMSYPAYLLLAVVAGATGGLTAPPSYLALLPQYFDRQLGLAIGLGVVGLGLGQIAMPLATGQLLAHLGLERAWLGIAATVAIIGLVNALLLVRDNPHHRRADRSGEMATLPGDSFAEAIGTTLFWQAAIAFLLIVMVSTALVLHFPAILADRGYSVGAGATAIALLGAGSLLARLATGPMLDRMSAAIPATLFFGGQVAGCLLLWSGIGGIAPFVAALLMGASLGAEGDMMPFMLRRAFGLRAFGRTYGLCFGLFQLGGVAGALLIGIAFDRLGSYGPVLLAFALSSSVATVLTVWAARRLARRTARHGAQAS